MDKKSAEDANGKWAVITTFYERGNSHITLCEVGNNESSRKERDLKYDRQIDVFDSESKAEEYYEDMVKKTRRKAQENRRDDAKTVSWLGKHGGILADDYKVPTLGERVNPSRFR